MTGKDSPLAPEKDLTPLVPLAPVASLDPQGCCPPPGPDADAPC